MMTCEHAGRKYEIRFHHRDVRFIRRFGEPDEKGKRKVLEVTPLTVKQQKKLGGNQTTVRVLDVTHAAAGEEYVVTAATVKHHLQADPYNKAHARWYALERALGVLTDEGLRRVLWKAYYAGTSWRPDGRDGFKLAFVQRRKGGLSEAVKRELVRWTETGGFVKQDGVEVLGR